MHMPNADVNRQDDNSIAPNSNHCLTTTCPADYDYVIFLALCDARRLAFRCHPQSTIWSHPVVRKNGRTAVPFPSLKGRLLDGPHPTGLVSLVVRFYQQEAYGQEIGGCFNITASVTYSICIE